MHPVGKECMGEQSIGRGLCQLWQSLPEKWRDLFRQCTSSQKRHKAILRARNAGATHFGTADLYRGVSGVVAASRQMTRDLINWEGRFSPPRPEEYNMGFVYLPTYLHTPWSTVFLDKLTASHLVKKFPAFYGTRKFITAFTSARHLSLS
jgi:hypothetical protein